jgi:hypothetical protein
LGIIPQPPFSSNSIIVIEPAASKYEEEITYSIIADE